MVFIVIVGFVWPMSDAAGRGKLRPLRPANVSLWRRKDMIRISDACFLWFGYEPPTRPEESAAWLRRNASLRVMQRHLKHLAQTTDVASEIDIAALHAYALERARLRGERVPAFLDNRQRDPQPAPVRSI